MNFFMSPLTSIDLPRNSDSSDCLLHSPPLGAIGLNGVWASVPYMSWNASGAGQQSDLPLRKRFVSELLNRAQHDFHAPSETHLFYAYYSKTSLVRSFHPLRDKAFEFYALLASNLAATNEDGRIQEWLAFIEENSPFSDRAAQTKEKDYPCSGVINFKLRIPDDSLLDTMTSRLSVSVSKLSAAILGDSLPTLNENTRRLGIPAQGVEIRRYMETLIEGRQRTVRVDKKIHANLIAKGHELSVSVSALASFLFHLYLTGVRSSEAAIINFR